MTDKYLCLLSPLRKEEVKQHENMYLDCGIKCILIYTVLEKPNLSILEKNVVSLYIRKQAEKK